MSRIIRNIISPFTLILIIFCCNKEDEPSNCETFKGNAKLYRVLVFESFASTAPLRVLEQYEYDDSGRISRFSLPMTTDPDNDSCYYYEIYHYNSKNQLANKERYTANIYSASGYDKMQDYIYTYSDNGKIIKEYIKSTYIDNYSYSTYQYSGDNLSKIVYYKMNTDEPESTIEYEYDECGRLSRENNILVSDPDFIYYTIYSYKDGLNYRSDDYAGRKSTEIEHIREMIKSYDSDNNLIITEIKELQEFSTQPSRVLHYEYYN